MGCLIKLTASAVQEVDLTSGLRDARTHAATQERGREGHQKAEKAAKAYAESAVGLAEAAHARGDRFFQVEIDVNPKTGGWPEVLSAALAYVMPKTFDPPSTASTTDVLGAIEGTGWHLEHVGYVYVPTGSSSSSDGEDSNVSHSGKTVGIYLFRRAKS